MHGVIERIVPDGRFGFIRGEDGREYFFHQTGLLGTDFDALFSGARVDFSVSESVPGDRPAENPRAVAVRLTADEVPGVANESLPPEKTRMEYPRNDSGGAFDDVPPPDVEGDEVLHASWASFPASDPPSWNTSR